MKMVDDQKEEVQTAGNCGHTVCREGVENYTSGSVANKMTGLEKVFQLTNSMPCIKHKSFRRTCLLLFYSILYSTCLLLYSTCVLIQMFCVTITGS